MRVLLGIIILAMLGHKINKNKIAAWFLGIIIFIFLMVTLFDFEPIKIDAPIVIAGIGALATAFTAWFIFLQLRVNEVLTRFTHMPNVDFALISGTTYCKRLRATSINLADAIDTRLVVKNSSRFPINFSIKGYTEVEYKTRGKESTRKNVEFFWSVPSRPTLYAHDSGDMLAQAIMGKRGKDINWSKETAKFRKKVTGIKNIKAVLEITYSPAIEEKSLTVNLKPQTWHFNPTSSMWEDPLGVSDNLITI